MWRPRLRLAEKTPEEVVDMLYGLFPPGRIWVKNEDGILYKLLLGIAKQFSRNRTAKVTDLFNEADPRTAVDTLADWEEALGVTPPAAATTAERQAACHAAYIATGGQSRPYYIQVAKAFNIAGPGGSGDPTITEMWPMVATCISPCYVPLYGPEYKFAWRLNLDASASTVTKTALETRLNRIKPANTYLFFVYS